jgi:hypothetical protein
MIEKLSNYIIKAYKKRNGRISFHYKTHLFIKTNTSFSISAYLTTIAAFFDFGDGTRIELDTIYLNTVPTVYFNGQYMVAEIHCSTMSKLTSVKNSMVDLTLTYSFFGHPCIDLDEYKSKALVKWMY